MLGDEDIDLDYHFRHSALPAPGGERELGVLVSRLHSQPLDRTKPLWEVHLIEGLEGDRFALYFKVHHSYFDGVGGTTRFAAMLSKDPDGSVKPLWSHGVTSAQPAQERLPLLHRANAAASGVTAGLRTVAELGKVTGMLVKEAARPSDEAMAVPFKAPSTPRLNGRVGRQRRFATQSYELNRIRAVSKASGTTINDVFVTITAGGLRRYLDELGELPESSLVAGAPVSIRVEGDTSANAITFIMLKMFTEVADPLERLRAVHRSGKVAKGHLKQLSKAAAEQYALLTNGPLVVQTLLGMAGRVPVPYNVVLSNVPGPRTKLFLNGARLDAFFPVSVVLHAQSLVVVSLGTVDTFNIGIVGDRDLLPHLQHLAVYIGECLADLEAALA